MLMEWKNMASYSKFIKKKKSMKLEPNSEPELCKSESL